MRRWLPDRTIVVVADSTYAVLELLAACLGLPSPVTMIHALASALRRRTLVTTAPHRDPHRAQ